MITTDPNISPFFYFTYYRIPSDFYESFSRLIPFPEYLQIVRSIVPFSWDMQMKGVWTHTTPPEKVSPSQGWKIHLSATPQNCKQILEKCSHICLDHEVAFKFLTDSFVFNTIMSKGWTRESTGKFITIYPVDTQHFQRIADDLYEALAQFKGPYILSDKRYKDSQVIYYRYGAFTGVPQLSIFGHTQTLLQSPEGALVPDGRSPFFSPPPWVSDPFASEDSPPPEGSIYLKDGRYRIETALQFSITGGTYKAVDMDTGKTVIVKEARPHTSTESNGRDAIGRMEKEYRLLKRLSGTGIAPEPIDLFTDWEHLFLVEELLNGRDLFTRVSSFDLETIDPQIQKESMHTIGANLTYLVKVAHDNNIVINDISPGNVLFSEADERLHLIDLEGAWEIGVDAPNPGFGTEGFRPPTKANHPSDDIYGVASLILSLIYPITPFLSSNPKNTATFLNAAEKANRLPSDMKQLLLKCLDIDERVRPTANEMLHDFDKMSLSISPDVLNSEDVRITDPNLNASVCKIVDHIKSTISFDRTDRLFPADPNVFLTNPLSISHGAAGVAYTLLHLEGEVPAGVVSWMLAKEISKDQYPPGLYLGISGIAWVFSELGLKEIALKLMKMASDHPLLWDLPDVYYGAAGFGLTCLYFHKETGDAYWLEQAARVGEQLINTKSVSDEGYYWPDPDGNIWCSYARGSAGIALFLLYLHFASGDRRFLDAGERALAYDLAQATEFRSLFRIPRAVTADPASLSVAVDHQKTYSHYWADGTAGVCTSLMRYIHVLGKEADKEMLERLMPDTFRGYTAFPSLFSGMAGLGNLQLDAFNFTDDPHYISEAFRITEGLLRFQIETQKGVAFPGDQLFRISTDFGSGSAGIALFLNRLRNHEQKLPNFNFLLDDLLCSKRGQEKT